jgi:hypothetical protein
MVLRPHSRVVEERIVRSSFFFQDRISQNRLVSAMWRQQIICFSSVGLEACKSLTPVDIEHGDLGALPESMQRTIRTKVTFGFLILAFGMMLTDVCRLMLAPSAAAMSATSAAQHIRKF